MEPRRGEARYRLLETIRQYGQDKLREAAEPAAVRRRHRDWYARLAAQAESETVEARQKSVFDRLEAEHENLRAALGWSLEQQEAETAAKIGAAISRFWLLHNYMSEGRRWLERTLSGFPDKNATRVKALNIAAILASLQDDNQTARILVEESLELGRELGDTKQTGYALYTLARLARVEEHYARAVTFLEESLSLFRELGQKDDMRWFSPT